jgi:hypothetical protein
MEFKPKLLSGVSFSLVLSLFSALFFPGVVVAFIMGEDDRVEIVVHGADELGVGQTGMIRIGNEEFVTGFLMGENCDVVVSAGHAAIYWKTLAHKGWKKGELRAGGAFKFSLQPESPGGWENMHLVSSGFRRRDQLEQDQHDWSIFRLESPALRQCVSLPFDGYKTACRGSLLMPGFHFDRPGVRLLDASCEVKGGLNGRLIVHDCDSKDGSSGAPLLCSYRGESRFIGINVSGLTERDYVGPGTFGQRGRDFNYRRHKNYAVAIHGEFLRALDIELRASTVRALAK